MFNSIISNHPKPGAIDHTAAIGQPGVRFEPGRHRLKLRFIGKLNPEAVIGTEHTAELLGAESGDGLGNPELLGDDMVVGSGGETEEADTEAEVGGEIERGADGER